MTSTQRQNLQANKASYIATVAKIDRVIEEIALSGTSSATISAAGGSKSYTRIDLPALQTLRADYVSRVHSINRALRQTSPGGVRTIQIVRY